MEAFDLEINESFGIELHSNDSVLFFDVSISNRLLILNLIAKLYSSYGWIRDTRIHFRVVLYRVYAVIIVSLIYYNYINFFYTYHLFI